jgi:hypothetical protein
MTPTKEQEDRLLKLISVCWNQQLLYNIDVYILNNYNQDSSIAVMKIEPGISIRIEDNVLYVTIDK